MKRLAGFTEEHDLFRKSFRRFLEVEGLPHLEQWNRQSIVDREFFAAAGENGFLGMDVPEAFGGGGSSDFRFNQIIGEETQLLGMSGAGLGLTLQNDICLPYFTRFTTDDQKQRWLPGICSGQFITAIAMTEPGAGSDVAAIVTTATRDGDDFILNGSKTFITNGINADLVIVAARTSNGRSHDSLSLLVVERGMAGFERGRNLEKIGLHSQDTAELFFTDVRVPATNVLGTEGQGFRHLMTNLSQERLSIAIAAMAASDAALTLALSYATEREAFGGPIADLQHTKFTLAELATEVAVSKSFIDQCVLALNDNSLTPEDAAMAKWWCTEVQGRSVDAALQIHGGYGYMSEQAVARAFVDARITRIYGGTTEIMKEIIGRSIVKAHAKTTKT